MVAVGGGFCQGKPGVGEGAGDHGDDQGESRDPGPFILRISIPVAAISAAEASGKAAVEVT